MPQNYTSNKYLAALNQEIQLAPKPPILSMFKKVHKKHANQQPERQVHVIYEVVSVLVERSSVCTSAVFKKEINWHNLFHQFSSEVRDIWEFLLQNWRHDKHTCRHTALV